VTVIVSDPEATFKVPNTSTFQNTLWAFKGSYYEKKIHTRKPENKTNETGYDNKTMKLRQSKRCKPCKES